MGMNIDGDSWVVTCICCEDILVQWSAESIYVKNGSTQAKQAFSRIHQSLKENNNGDNGLDVK